MVFAHAPEPVGIVGPFVAAASFLSGLSRLRRALWLNHRYWFTTWRWARVVVAMLAAGAVLKLTLPS